MATETKVSNEALDIDINDFLPIGGEDETPKPASIFSKPQETDTSFLEKKQGADNDSAPAAPDNKNTEPPVDPAVIEDTLKILDQDLNDQPTDDDQNPTRRKTDKSGLVETFSKLIEEGVIIPFEDDKPLEEYSLKDFKELLTENIKTREKEVAEKAPEEFLKGLPEEIKLAAKYVQDGGTDLKSLFASLARQEEVRSLNVADPNDQEEIVRQYLYASTDFSDDEIEEQIELARQANLIEKKAKQVKPKLDELHNAQIQKQLQEQESLKKQTIALRENYKKQVFETLKPGELNGIKLDSKKANFFWEELTSSKYKARNGRPTNLLGHLLEKHQFGEQPRHDLVVEALWLLNNPEEYKEEIRKQAKKEVTVETVRKLKTAEASKVATTTPSEDTSTETQKKRIPRPTNIFKR